MAPEQWEGKPGDARTDIYCFGCVLYEMLTGKRALQEGRASLESPLLDSIVRTCMEQVPEDRWQTASDVRRAMMLPAPTAPRPSRAPQWAVLVVLAMLAAGLSLAPWYGRAPAGDAVVSFAIYPPEKTAFSSSIHHPPLTSRSSPSLRMDASIVFAAGAEGERPLLWRRPIDQVAAQPLPGTEDAQDPFWSPDSRWIGFFAEGKLKKIPAAGGAVEVVVPTVRDVRGGTWGQDDTILFANSADPIQRVADQQEGSRRRLQSRQRQTSPRTATRSFLPDGRPLPVPWPWRKRQR